MAGVWLISIREEIYRVRRIFILPSQRGKDVAQEVFRPLKEHDCDAKRWERDSIL
ncbi:MAG: hypothetical protein GX046_08950 [Tissierellia bacterium]|nr:hypothetical protein [Tissierellia bacterium]